MPEEKGPETRGALFAPADQVVRIESPRVDSTNLWGRRLLTICQRSEYQPPAFDLVAAEQQDGRGRRSREWSSPAGAGLYASLVRAIETARIGRLPISVSVALADALAIWVEVGLKWPNDLLVDGRKIGGVLIESLSRDERSHWVVVGIGINRLDRDLPPGATALERELDGDTPTPDELADRCLRAVQERCVAGVDESTLERYSALSVHRPGQTIRCDVGDRRVEGEFVGFSEQGFLRVKTSEQTELISSGEIVE